MKAEHRHELKTNELAEWLANFPQWAKENRNTIIYISVFIVAVAGYYLWYNYQKNVVSIEGQLKFTDTINRLPIYKTQIIKSHQQGLDTSYSLIQIADDIQAVARNTKNDTAAGLALIKQAEILRAELHYRYGDSGSVDIKDQIKLAKHSYTEALAKVSSSPSLMAAAKFGLGLCEEELGNFTEAEQIYTNIISDASLQATTASAQAKQRLATMADYKQNIVFKSAPKTKPAEIESSQPQIQLTGADINLPGQQK